MPAEPKVSAIGRRIKAARELEGLSQSQAAKKWEINLRTLQSWELRDGREPRGLARKALESILAKIERKHSR